MPAVSELVVKVAVPESSTVAVPNCVAGLVTVFVKTTVPVGTGVVCEGLVTTAVKVMGPPA